MKIISKFKDYYDYLTGIYGVDEKLILDRTEFISTRDLLLRYSNPSIISVFIADKLYEGLFFEGNFYWGDDLLQFEYIDSRKKNGLQKNLGLLILH